MASFDNAPKQSNDPSYLGFSRGTDNASLQPLANVPELNTKYVQPDYKADRSLGSLFEGLGNIGKEAVQATDGIIKKNIDDTLNASINKIRDGFGVAAARDLSNGVAVGMGRAGAEGVSLTDNSNGGEKPIAINRFGNRIDGLAEAYRQGALSNSAYYAKMDALVDQTIRQYPGYENEVRDMAAQKLGVNPANALRSSLLQDATALQNKVQAQNDKWTNYENQNAQYIYQRWPNYESLKQNGTAPSQGEVRQVVGQMQARDYFYQSKQAAFNAGKVDIETQAINAEATATQKAYDLGSGIALTIPNTMGIKTPQDFTQLLNDVRNGKRAPLTPDEKQQLTGIIATMEQQYNLAFDRFMNDKSQGPITTAIALNSQDKYNKIKAIGMQTIADLKSGLVDDKTGLLVATANHSKAITDASENDILRRSESAAMLAAGRRIYGDQGIQYLLQQSAPLLNAQLEGLRGLNQGAIAQGGSSLRETIDKYKANGTNDGNLNRATIQDTVNTILGAEKATDPTIGQRAVQHAFGPGNSTLLDAWNQKNQIDVFTQLVRPEVTKKIEKMDKKSRDTYFSWANESFTQVYSDQVSQANKTVQDYSYNGKLKVVYDPSSQNFHYEGGMGVPGAVINSASRGLQGLNTAINTMKDVWRVQGRDVTEALMNNLIPAGIEPGSPVYLAIQREYLKQKQTTSANP